MQMVNIQSGAWLMEAYHKKNALGPFRFLNEMPLQTNHGRLLQYADNIALICMGISLGEVHQCLTEDLQSTVSSWIRLSRMKLKFIN